MTNAPGGERMNVLKETYRRLDAIQRTLWFQITATSLVLLICGGLFGTLIYTSYSIDSQRVMLINALEDQNLARRDVHAVSLHENATVRIGGRTYTSQYFAANPDWIFDEEGRIAVPRIVVEDMLSDQIPAWAPNWLLDQPGTTWLLAIVITIWLLLIIWMTIALPFVLTLAGTGAAIGLILLMSLVGRFNPEQAMVSVAGIGLLTFTYVLLTRAALILYQRPNQILAVAHTVIKEASRSRISLVFIVLLLVMLPLIPLWLDPEAPLRFRIQTFISRSMGLTFVLAAFMTLFLACATVAFEIRDRQIWQLMTKPLSRINYILGKWLGVVTVNLILLTISGVSTFTFLQYMRTLPVAPGIEGQLDRLQVNNEIMTARVPAHPVYPSLTTEQLRERIEQEIDRNPDLAGTEVPLNKRREIAEEIRNRFDAAQRSIPPGHARTYEFTGLSEAKRRGSTLTLRYRFFILNDDPHETFPAAFVINDDMDTVRRVTYVPTMSHVQVFSPDDILDDGTIRITIANLHEPPPDTPALGSMNFERRDLELLYQVANFEGNFFRAVMVSWIKLAFLAMLGIACATFLSFPVACLLSFTIFVAGSLSSFLASSLDLFYPPEISQVDWTNIGMVIQWAFESFVRAVAQGLVFTLRAFGEYSPTQSLVEGRLIPWSAVGSSMLTLGLIWSGLAMLVGYLVIRSRQLAVYSGQG
jgi:hypothetical protein